MHVFLDDFEICNLPNSGRRHENCFASIRTCNTGLSTRSANRTHARKRAVSGLVIQITINHMCKSS
jgi:hypothetical protein